jgi:hypothetical protein
LVQACFLADENASRPHLAWHATGLSWTVDQYVITPGKNTMQKIHFGGYHSVEIKDQRVVLVIEKQESQFRAKEET